MSLPYSDPDAPTKQPDDIEKKTNGQKTFRAMIERVKQEHPLSAKMDKKKPVLYRSKLIQYEKTYGRPFRITEAYEIIEDVPE